MKSKIFLAAVFCLLSVMSSRAFASKVYAYACNYSSFEKRINFVFDPDTKIGFYQGIGVLGPVPSYSGKEETEYGFVWYWHYNSTTKWASLIFENSILRGEKEGLVRQNISMPLRGYCTRMGELEIDLAKEAARLESLPHGHRDKTYLDLSK